jgi:hypothetical protein
MFSITEKTLFMNPRDSQGTSSKPAITGGPLQCGAEYKDTAITVRNDVIQYSVET